MVSSAFTHVGFADESHWNERRFRSVSLVTLPVKYLQTFNDELQGLLKQSNIKEFKWKKLSSANARQAAKALCNFTVREALQGHLRIDVLIWDIEDTRHKVIGRDDVANLQRMYFHLFRNVMRKRWPSDACWRLHLDQNTGLSFKKIQEFLEKVSNKTEPQQDLFTKGGVIHCSREFSIQEVLSVRSQDHPLLQLADLFAGLAVFSKMNFGRFKKWLNESLGQIELFNEPKEINKLSHAEKERFEVLYYFYYELCKRSFLCVSLEEMQGLRTYNPEYPINFWLYQSQHPDDKAPVRAKS